jgi:hypothetical protein
MACSNVRLQAGEGAGVEREGGQGWVKMTEIKQGQDREFPRGTEFMCFATRHNPSHKFMHSRLTISEMGR